MTRQDQPVVKLTRKDARLKGPLHPLLHPLLLEVSDGGEIQCSTVFVYEVSSAGIRGKWEHSLPDRGFLLRLDLRSGWLVLTARTSWQCALPDGTVLGAVAFLEVDDGQRTRIDAEANWLVSHGGGDLLERSGISAWKSLPVEVQTSDACVTMIATDLTVHGIELLSDQPLEEDRPVTLLLPLAWNLPLTVPARVRSQRTNASGTHRIQLDFVDLDEPSQSLIGGHIR